MSLVTEGVNKGVNEAQGENTGLLTATSRTEKGVEKNSVVSMPPESGKDRRKARALFVVPEAIRLIYTTQSTKAITVFSVLVKKPRGTDAITKGADGRNFKIGAYGVTCFEEGLRYL